MEFHLTYSGVEFNRINRERLYKLTRVDECHHGMNYSDGLNVDILTFNPTGEGLPGGLYFFSEKQLEELYHFVWNPCWMRLVTIPDDAQVYCEPGKYKADKIILGPRKRFWLDEVLDETTCLKILRQDFSFVRYIINEHFITQEVCDQAAKDHKYEIWWVPDRCKTQKMCDDAVKRHGGNLRWVPDFFKTQKMCDDAVENYACSIQWVPDCFKTQKMCDDAIMRNPRNIKHTPDRFTTQEKFSDVVKRCRYVSIW